MKEKIKIAFQGEKGAYSHLVSLKFFPNINAKACATFEKAFQLAKASACFLLNRRIVTSDLCFS